MSGQGAWLAELGRVAEELHLGIVELRVGEITLHDFANSETEITIRSLFLSGDLIRRTVRPAEERKP